MTDPVVVTYDPSEIPQEKADVPTGVTTTQSSTTSAPGSTSSTTVTAVIAPEPESAWTHFSAVLGAIILVGAALFDSMHGLNSVDWTAIGVAAATCGAKGFTPLGGR